jgi:hypothetical protein
MVMLLKGKDAPPLPPPWYFAPPVGCGVGSTKYNPNFIEGSKLDAETAARTDLARQVQSQVGTVVTAVYSRASSSDAGGEAMEATNRASSDLTVLGVRPVGHQISGEKLYLMLCIEPGGLAKKFEEMAYLDDAIRVALAQGARDTFGKQAAQLAALGLQ